MPEQFQFDPFPKREGAGIPASIPNRLDALVVILGSERLAAINRSVSPVEVVYDRLLHLTSEESWAWDDSSRDNLDLVRWSFAVSAYQHFPRWQQLALIRDHTDERRIGMLAGDELQLTSDQIDILNNVSTRAGVIINKNRKNISLKFLEQGMPKRITEIEDHQVTTIIQEETEDRVGNVLAKLDTLSLIQKVQLLLKLSKQEYEEFKKRLAERNAGLLTDLEDNPELIPGLVDRIKARSELAYGTPIYVVETDIRRRMIDNGFEYNPIIDAHFFEPIDTKEYEFARDFYRIYYYPYITHPNYPTPITLGSLYRAYREYHEAVFGSSTSYSEITMSYLVNVLRKFIQHDADNEENRTIHQKVLTLAAQL